MITSDTCTLAALYFLGYVIGSTFLDLVFLQDVHQLQSKTAFGIVFSMSFVELIMVLSQSAQWLDGGFRGVVWKMSMLSSQTLLGFVIPICIVIALLYDTSSRRSSSKRTFGSTLTALGGILIVCALGGFVCVLSSWVSEKVIRGMAFSGVALMAVLSGYGAVTTPYTYLLPYFWRTERVDLLELQRSLHTTLEQVLTKSIQMAKLKKQSSSSATTGGGSTLNTTPPSGISKVWSAVKQFGSSSSSVEASIAELQREIVTLHSNGSSIYIQTHEAAERSESVALSFTLKGRLYTFLGVFLSVYCVCKVCLTCVNLLLQRSSSIDPVTRAVTLLSTTFGLESLNLIAYVNQISFMFLTILIASSVRGLLLSIFKALTAYASTIGAETITLAFTEAMGLYFFACVILIRGNLPIQHRAEVTEALGVSDVLDFSFYQRVFDMTFVGVAIG
eukprot:PhF_6_TR29328/c0_g1_i2/m.43042/K22193/GPR89, GPHR; golgi pH regulator